MNLDNFHKHISQKIYERGEEYYNYDSINNVEHDYPGGTEIVDTLLTHFKSVYSNRRAMMEELCK
ncbi:hypothetical protein FACS1894123_11470 [Bacteroidia bacterium]|nr:hypothetical protein FACS1894123_11470 [Bacteroidia bacterium]